MCLFWLCVAHAFEQSEAYGLYFVFSYFSFFFYFLHKNVLLLCNLCIAQTHIFVSRESTISVKNGSCMDVECWNILNACLEFRAFLILKVKFLIQNSVSVIIFPLVSFIFIKMMISNIPYFITDMRYALDDLLLLLFPRNNVWHMQLRK